MSAEDQEDIFSIGDPVEKPVLVLKVGMPLGEGEHAAGVPIQMTLTNEDGSNAGKFQPWMLEVVAAAVYTMQHTREVLNDTAITSLILSSRKQRAAVQRERDKAVALNPPENMH